MGLWVSIVRECIQLQCGYWRGSHSHFWHLSSSAVCGTLVITVTLQQAPFFQSFPIPTTHSGHTVAWVIFFNMQIWFRHSSYFFFFFQQRQTQIPKGPGLPKAGQSAQLHKGSQRYRLMQNVWILKTLHRPNKLQLYTALTLNSWLVVTLWSPIGPQDKIQTLQHGICNSIIGLRFHAYLFFTLHFIHSH